MIKKKFDAIKANEYFSEKKVTLVLLVIFSPAGFIYWLTHLKKIKTINEPNWFFNHPFITWLIIYTILGVLVSI